MTQQHSLPLLPSRLNRGPLVKLATNAFAILAGDMTTRVASFVLYALVARHLGTHEFGQMSLGLTYFQSFQFLAVAGIQALVTREVARNRSQTGRYLVNANVAVAGFSLLSVALLVVVAQLLHYTPDTTAVILWLAVGLLPYAISTIYDAVFQAWEQMQHIAYANLVVNLLRIGGCWWLLTRGYGLMALVTLLLAAHIVTVVVKWWLARRYLTDTHAAIDLPFCWQLCRNTLTFLGIDGLVAIMSAFQVILLSKFANEREVGLFNAASQLLVPVSLVFQSAAISIFPAMCRGYQQGAQRLGVMTERLLELLLLVVVPSAVALCVFADDLLQLLYGKAEFAAAAPALQILVGAMVLRVFTQVLGRVLVASLQEKITLRILLVDTLASVVLGFLLIPTWGLLGAAVSTVLVRLLDVALHYVPVTRSLPQRLALEKGLWLPLLATGGALLYWLTPLQQPPLLALLIGGLLYGLLAGVIALVSLGSVDRLKERYRVLTV
jgi:O-antigen/teichoic acid export membrane protein